MIDLLYLLSLPLTNKYSWTYYFSRKMRRSTLDQQVHIQLICIEGAGFWSVALTDTQGMWCHVTDKKNACSFSLCVRLCVITSVGMYHFYPLQRRFRRRPSRLMALYNKLPALQRHSPNIRPKGCCPSRCLYVPVATRTPPHRLLRVECYFFFLTLKTSALQRALVWHP